MIRHAVMPAAVIATLVVATNLASARKPLPAAPTPPAASDTSTTRPRSATRSATRPATRPTTRPSGRPGRKIEPTDAILTTSGKRLEGALVEVSKARVVFRDESGKRHDLPAGQVDWVGPDRYGDDPIEEPGAKFDTLEMRNGARLFGRLVGFGENAARFDIRHVGTVDVPVEGIQMVIRRGRAMPENLPDSPDLGVVYANRGDRLVGHVTADAQNGLVVDSTALKFRVKFDQIDAVFFPAPKDANASGGEASGVATVALDSGSLLVGRDVRIADDQIHMTLPGDQPVTVARKHFRELVFGLAVGGMGRRTVLVWGGYADLDEELQRTVKALKGVLPKSWKVVTNTDKELTDELSQELRRARALVIAEMERHAGPKTHAVAQKLKTPLQQFCRRGGNVVFLGLNGNHTHSAIKTGLIQIQQASNYGDGQNVSFTPAGKWLGEGVGTTFEATNATMAYRSTGKEKLEVYAGKDGRAAAIGRRVGRGFVTALGMDFYEFNEGTARMLANACRRRR